MIRPLFRLALATTAVAVAVWLVPASVHIVSWPASGPERIALVAPRIRLVVALAAALAVTAAIGLATRRRPSVLLAVAGAAFPLTLLWLWAVPYMPWLPDRAPLLLVFSGPLRWVVAGVALARAVWVTARRHLRTGWPVALPGRKTVCVVSFIVYLVLGQRSAATLGFGGDEPHYLIIAHSLLVDHDLKIENNHARGDYRGFYAGAELRPDYLQRGANGEIYSIHAPGLPAVLLPAYAVGGGRAAVTVMALMAAAAALAIFDLAAALGGPAVGSVTWLTVCLTVPFVPHSWLIFPENPGALIMAWAALWLWRPLPERSAVWFGRGAVLATLPWLHTKFVVLLGLFALFLVARIWRRVGVTISFAAPIAVSLALWFLSFYIIYGTLDPQAPYGAYTKMYLLFASNMPRGMFGLLADQKFGLLVVSPVYCAAAVGAVIMLRERSSRLFAGALLLTIAAFVGSSTRLYMWWGGSSAPARFLVPVLPLLAPFIARAYERGTSVAARAAFWTAGAYSLAYAAVGVAEPRRLFLFSDPHGYSRLLSTIQSGAPLVQSLPTFTNENWQAPLLLLLPWILALLVTVGALLFVAKSRSRLAMFQLSVLGMLTFAFTASLAAGGWGVADRAVVVREGQQSMLAAYDDDLRGFDFARLAKASDADLAVRGAIVVTRSPVAGSEASARRNVEGPFDLPPGRYQARVWLDGQRDRPGEAAVFAANQLAIARAPFNVNPTTIPFELPVTMPVWIGVTDASVSPSLRRVDVTASQIVPSDRRLRVPVRAVEPVDGQSGALLVYTDQNAYPEHSVFWTRGTDRAVLLVAPAGARRLEVTLHVGPNAGPVRLEIAGKEYSLTMAAEETRQMDVPLEGDVPVPLTAEASQWFRPSEADPRSKDQRRLGIQVRIATH